VIDHETDEPNHQEKQSQSPKHCVLPLSADQNICFKRRKEYG
jgi:hypothetical protein